ncbi:MAG TPA: NUDIX domain-containing protein [Streptosporangiaceae bacterium]
MTDAQRSAADSGRYKVTGDVHLVLLDDDGRVLLGRRKNTGFADGCYHLPAGHLEAGESVIDAPGNLVDYCRSALAAIADGKPFSLSGWQNSRFTGAATGTCCQNLTSTTVSSYVRRSRKLRTRPGGSGGLVSSYVRRRGGWDPPHRAH